MRNKILLILLLISTPTWASKFTPVTMLFGGGTLGNMANTLTSYGIDLNQLPLGSIQCSWSGTPTGSLAIQVSNDIVAVPYVGDPAGNVVNWSTYTGSAEATGGTPGNFLYNLLSLGYRWARLSYTPASGTGSLAATFSGKGN